MKVGYICEKTNNAYYRAIMPLRALQVRGHTIAWPNSLDDDVPMRQLLTCDVVHCYRSLARLPDLRRLSEHGVAVSFDNDDNYAAAEVSEHGKGHAARRYNAAFFRHVLKVARLSDITTTPSDALAHIYRSAGVPNVATIENRLERSMPGFGAPRRHTGVVVGWVAASEHQLDLERLALSGPLTRLLDAHGSLTIVSVGLRLPLRHERYKHIESIPFPQLLTATGGFDIGIAPLADTEFNRSRSNVKLKEYASGGAAWLASPVGPYRSLGERQGGRLVADSDWFAAIEELINAGRRRRRYARKALKWAKGETLERHVDAWEAALESAIDARASRRT